MMNDWQRRLGQREAGLVTVAVSRHGARVSLDDYRNEYHISMTVNAFSDLSFGIIDKLNGAHERATELMLEQLASQQSIIDSVEMQDKQKLIDEIARLNAQVKKLAASASVADRVMESITGKEGEA
jgi:hypothetical protein